MALRVEKQVAGLHVSVKEIGRVEVLETLQALVDYVLFVDVFEDIGSDYSM